MEKTTKELLQIEGLEKDKLYIASTLYDIDRNLHFSACIYNNHVFYGLYNRFLNKIHFTDETKLCDCLCKNKEFKITPLIDNDDLSTETNE